MRIKIELEKKSRYCRIEQDRILYDKEIRTEECRAKKKTEHA